MLSRHEKNSRILIENYDSWKTSTPDYREEEIEEYYEEFPEELLFEQRIQEI